MSQTLTNDQKNGFVDDFSSGISTSRWRCYEKVWGKGNNGCVMEYLDMDTQKVVMYDGTDLGNKNCVVIWSHGEQFSSSSAKKAVPGVRRVSGGFARDAPASRVGSCLVSADSFCSGEYKVDLKFESPTLGSQVVPGAPRGMLFSVWTFHYEEHRAGSNPAILNQSDLQYSPADLTTGTNYSTVNSEIDAPEIGAQGSWTKGLFNCYVSERRADYKTANLPSNLLDGRFHRLSFKWETELAALDGLKDSQVKSVNGYARLAVDNLFTAYQGMALIKKADGRWYAMKGKSVTFYLDNVLISKSTFCSAVAARLVIGTWFPDWAGTAPWEWARVWCSRVEYIPAKNEGDVWFQKETYPTDGIVAVLPARGMPSVSRLALEQQRGFEDRFESGLSADRWRVFEKQFGSNPTDGGAVPENFSLDYDTVTMFDGKAVGKVPVLNIWAHGDVVSANPIRPAVSAVKNAAGGPMRQPDVVKRVGACLTTRYEFCGGTYEVDLKFNAPWNGATQAAASTFPTGATVGVWTQHYEEHFCKPGDTAGGAFNPDDPQYVARYKEAGGPNGFLSTVLSEIDGPLLGVHSAFSTMGFNTYLSRKASKAQSLALPSAVNLADGKYHTFKFVWENQVIEVPQITDDMVMWSNGYYRLKNTAAALKLPVDVQGDALFRNATTNRWNVLSGKKVTLYLDNQLVGTSDVVSAVAAQLVIGIWFSEPALAANWEWASISVARVKITPSLKDGDVWFQASTNSDYGIVNPPVLTARESEDHAIPFSSLTKDQYEGFTETFADGVSADRWRVMESVFGGNGSNGCVPEYVTVEKDTVTLWNGTALGEKNVVALWGHGEKFDAASTRKLVAPGVRRVNTIQNVLRDAPADRVGSCLVTQCDIGSSTVEVDLKVEVPTIGGAAITTGKLPAGAAIAVYTFHYEIHRNDPLDFQYADAQRQGSSELYSTVLSEIDGPMLGYGGSFKQASFSSYCSERAASYQQIDISSLDLADGKYHRLGFTWETTRVPLDGVKDSDVGWANGYYRLLPTSAAYRSFPAYQGYALLKSQDKWNALVGKRVGLLIDGKEAGAIDQCVPAVGARLMIGFWFPSWAGQAQWEWARVLISQVKVTPRRDPGDTFFQVESFPNNGIIAPLDPNRPRFFQSAPAPVKSSFPAKSSLEYSRLIALHSRDEGLYRSFMRASIADPIPRCEGNADVIGASPASSASSFSPSPSEDREALESEGTGSIIMSHYVEGVTGHLGWIGERI
eukprot:ANDGO_01514.mRNA.1 hypothetical protein